MPPPNRPTPMSPRTAPRARVSRGNTPVGRVPVSLLTPALDMVAPIRLRHEGRASLSDLRLGVAPVGIDPPDGGDAMGVIGLPRPGDWPGPRVSDNPVQRAKARRPGGSYASYRTSHRVPGDRDALDRVLPDAAKPGSSGVA